MGRDNFQPGEFIECALEDQVRQRNGGLHRIGDRVGQPAIAGQLLVELGDALRMNEQRRRRAVSALPRPGKNFGSENASPATLPPIARPFSPCFLTAVSEFLHRQIGRLQRQRGEGGKSGRFCSAELGEFFVLQLDHLAGQFAIALVQFGLIDSTSISTACESIAASRLSISMTTSSPPGPYSAAPGRAACRLRDDAMGVHVDGPDPLARDHDRNLLARGLRLCTVQHATAAEDDPGGGSGATAQESHGVWS